MENEIWLPIKGYEGLYEVSNLGNVKSLNYHRENIAKVMIPGNDKDGYKGVNITKNKIHKTRKVHRLVAQAFIPNPDNKPQVNHKNGIKHDNRAENLEWCTNSENRLHSFRVLKNENPMKGRFGSMNARSKKCAMLTLDGEIINIFESQQIASKEVGISQPCISSCINGKSKTAGGFVWRNT